jgi:homopolymeric O-antigen transport system ATP-binding protein
MSVAIKIENLSKQYRLGLVSTRTVSHDLNRWWQTSILRREDPYLKVGDTNDRTVKGVSEYIWALRDINLDVKEGEVLGIIGKNGAGKSTLLKILSKVTAPTTGTIKARGRIASLLEVGTGFHLEMTGRENIFMNGSIMGMTKAEIRNKFDEILDFAGVEKYVDTPVKRYSSGMIVRLGFAIAAHLEPEILVVDEVLAVGDAEFQRKAIGKMQDVSSKQGRTVLLVSHNMSVIGDLCKRAIILSKGNIYKRGPVKDIINAYLEIAEYIDVIREWRNIGEAPGDMSIKLRKMYAVNKHGNTVQYSLTTEKIGIYIEYDILKNLKFFTLGINLYTSTGIHIFSSHESHKYEPSMTLTKGTYSTIAWIPGNLLQEGNYLISVAGMRYKPFTILFDEKELLRIQIIDTINQSAKPEDCNLDLPGLIRPKLSWETRTQIISNQ